MRWRISSHNTVILPHGRCGKESLSAGRRSLVVLLAMAALAVLPFACSDEPEDDFGYTMHGAPDEIVVDFLMQESDSGLVRWQLTAPKASKYNAKKLILMEKPTIRFYDDIGDLQTTLNSDNGEYREDTRDMLAIGNVIVVSVEGDVLETDSLLWVEKEEKIVSDSFVKLTRGNDIITGIGLECDYNLTSVNIQRDVKATIVDEKGKRNE